MPSAAKCNLAQSFRIRGQENNARVGGRASGAHCTTEEVGLLLCLRLLALCLEELEALGLEELEVLGRKYG